MLQERIAEDSGVGLARHLDASEPIGNTAQVGEGIPHSVCTCGASTQ
jgi:hypothetical protein